MKSELPRQFIDQWAGDLANIRRTDSEEWPMTSEDDSDRETMYLMRSPTNAARLAEGIAQLDSGDTVEVETERPARELE